MSPENKIFNAAISIFCSNSCSGLCCERTEIYFDFELKFMLRDDNNSEFTEHAERKNEINGLTERSFSSQIAFYMTSFECFQCIVHLKMDTVNEEVVVDKQPFIWAFRNERQ